MDDLSGMSLMLFSSVCGISIHIHLFCLNLFKHWMCVEVVVTSRGYDLDGVCFPDISYCQYHINIIFFYNLKFIIYSRIFNINHIN